MGLLHWNWSWSLSMGVYFGMFRNSEPDVPLINHKLGHDINLAVHKQTDNATFIAAIVAENVH